LIKLFLGLGLATTAATTAAVHRVNRRAELEKDNVMYAHILHKNLLEAQTVMDAQTSGLLATENRANGGAWS
jgi:hypothetical protein